MGKIVGTSEGRNVGTSKRQEQAGEGQSDEENEGTGVDGAEEVIELENGGDESEAGPEGIEKRKSLEG